MYYASKSIAGNYAQSERKDCSKYSFLVLSEFAMWLLPCGYRYGINYINVIKFKLIVFMFAFHLYVVYKSSF